LEDPIELKCRFKSYDREVGVGKLRSDALPRILNFVVPLERRASLHHKVLDAMKSDVTRASFLVVVDNSNLPTSLIILDILENQ
jgi:hypothetical protein